MTQEEARQWLEELLWCAQRARSTQREAFFGEEKDPLMEKVLADLHPWLYGPGNIVEGLIDYLGRLDRGRPIYGLEFFNWMWIPQREPALQFVRMFTRKAEEFPEPDVEWIQTMPSQILEETEES
jgi:hypothetical protein